MMQFKDKLKEIRKLRNWSQQQFADKLEEKRSTYAEWENGRIPSFDIVVKISAVANVPLSEFVELFNNAVADKARNDDFSAIPEVKHGNEKGILPVKQCVIQLKTASGKLLNIQPGSESEVAILNAFLEERDRIITEKEQQQKDAEQRAEKAEKEKDRLLTIIEKNLTELLINSRESKESSYNAYTEMQVEHAAMMGALDLIRGDQAGTLAVKAGKAEHDLKEAIKEDRKKRSLSKTNKSH